MNVTHSNIIICDNLPLSLTQSYDNNQDEYGAPAGPVQTSNQDSYGSPSGPVQGRYIKLHVPNYILINQTEIDMKTLETN